MICCDTKKKKILALVTVLLIVVTEVFAGFSGVVRSGFSYDLDTSEYGFIKNNTTGLFTVDLIGNTMIRKGRGAIFAEAKGMLSLYLTNGEQGTPFPGEGGVVITPTAGLSLMMRMDYARLIGPGWEIGLLATPNMPDYAKSPIDIYTVSDARDSLSMLRNDYKENASAPMTYYKAPGGYVKYHDYIIGLGIEGKKDSFDITAYAETPRYALGDVAYIKTAGYVSHGTFNTQLATTIGFSAKFGYSGRNFQFALAGDSNFQMQGTQSVAVSGDASASLSYGFIHADIYYATRAKVDQNTFVLHLLSSRITTDFDWLGVPLRISLAVRDILAKQDIQMKVGYAVTDKFLAEFSGGYVVANNGRVGEYIQGFSPTFPRIGKWSTGLDITYRQKYVFDTYTGISVSQVIGGPLVLGAHASVESEAIIPGAKLSLGWIGDDLTRVLPDNEVKDGHLGKITATCIVEF